MTSKVHDKGTSREGAPDTDTSSYTQPHGKPEAGTPPNRRNVRTPHERDESARSTGDRLDEDPVPSDRQISDAHDDVEAGRVDTDRRGVPSDVPTSKPKPGE